MKAKFIFKLPKESTAFLAAAKADSMASALWDIVYNLRKRTEQKYETEGLRDASEIIDYIFNDINNLLDSHGINIDDLTE